jgi:phosphatidylglycerophosphatase C
MRIGSLTYFGRCSQCARALRGRFEGVMPLLMVFIILFYNILFIMTNNANVEIVAIFDLDGTLTWRDTLLSFLAHYFAARPARLLRLWRLPEALWAYVRSGADRRGALKGRVIRMAMSGDARAHIDSWAGQFVASMQARGVFRPAALAVLQEHRQAGHHLVLMSASPDIYVAKIGELLGFEQTVCTELQWRGDRLDGTLRGANCLGEEKLRQLKLLRARYPAARFVAYGNSSGDLVHLRQVDQATLVNATRTARQQARLSGITVGDWR